MKSNILIVIIFPVLAFGGALRDNYCSGVTVDSDPKIFSLAFQLINSSQSVSQLVDFAQNKQDFNEYFQDTLGWFVLFCVLTFFSIVLIVTSLSCVSCPACCTACKKDLKRADYKKSEKVRPFILFLFCSLCSMALAGYGIYLITQVTTYYNQSRCTSARFAEDLNNETTDGFVGFSQSLSGKLTLLNNLLDDLNTTRYIDSNNTWIREYYNNINGLIVNISSNYTNYAVKDFNNGSSVLTILQQGYFGPYDQSGTIMYQMNQEKNEICGNKLNELQYIYNDSLSAYNVTSRKNLTKALKDMVSIKQSASEIYSQIPSILNMAHPYAFAALLILFIAFIFMSVGLILSNLSFCCVVGSQEKKFKYLSNIGWFTSSFSILMIFTVCLAFSFGGGVLVDFCKIQNNLQSYTNAQKYPKLISPELGAQLNECIFGQHKNLKSSLGIISQIDSITSLQTHSSNFQKATSKNNVTFNNNLYLTLETYRKTPATLLKFVTNSSMSNQIQPLQQIDLINIVSNTNYPNNTSPCDSCQDLYNEANCTGYKTSGYIVLESKNPSSYGKPQLTCIDMTAFNFTYITQRYSGSTTSCVQFRDRYTQYRTYYEQLSSKPTGVLQGLMDSISLLTQNETTTYSSISHIKTNVDSLKKKLDDANKDISLSTIDQALNCSILSTSYKSFIQPVCEAVIPGVVELMSISLLIGFLNLLNSIFGVCFVIRNKIDVPRIKNQKEYEKLYKKKAKTNGKKSNEDVLSKYGKYGIKTDEQQTLPLNDTTETLGLNNSITNNNRDQIDPSINN